ncbi:hypothetical protein [Stenotrophomonas sp.]|uniref:hypothetical protein n=1 Tax=Stenotrophomonas sp. TaxID=69392 RepID=UPI00289F9BAD|nr:hypothetical protein [Stenotrophomonas sp.]
MNLTDYASSKGGTAKLGCPVLTTVAAAANCSAATLYMVARGHKSVGAALALRIAAATDQLVAAADLRPDLYAHAVAALPARGEAATESCAVSKRALRTRLGLSSDAHLAKVLQLPVEQVAAWPEKQGVPALPQVLQLLGVQKEQPAALAAPNDPDANRVIQVQVA